MLGVGVSITGTQRRSIPAAARLARVLASDFAGGELVGEDGTTFTNAVTALRPTNPGGVVTFGAMQSLAFAWSGSLEGKTLFLVATVTNGSGTTSALLKLSGPDGVAYELRSRTTNANFNATNSFAGMGLSNSDNSGRYGLANRTNDKTLYAFTFTANDVLITIGEEAGSRQSYSGGSRTIDKIELGLGTNSATFAFTFNEFVLLDSADDDDVNAEMARLAEDHSVSYVPRTPYFGKPILWLGDSTAFGTNTAIATSGAGALDRYGIRDLFWQRYLPAVSDLSNISTFIVPRSDTTGDPLARSWVNVTANAANYPAGCQLVAMHYGVNDHRIGDVSLGSISDAAGTGSIYAGLKQGLANVRAELGASVPVLFIGPQYFGGPSDNNPPGEETYSGAKSMQDIRDAMAAVAATDAACYYIDANAFGTGSPTLNRANWATYTTKAGGTPDYLHPNADAQALAWAVAKPGFDAVLIP